MGVLIFGKGKGSPFLERERWSSFFEREKGVLCEQLRVFREKSHAAKRINWPMRFRICCSKGGECWRHFRKRGSSPARHSAKLSIYSFLFGHAMADRQTME